MIILGFASTNFACEKKNYLFASFCLQFRMSYFILGLMKICQIEGCNKKEHARGLCNSHYQLARRRGTLMPKFKSDKCCVISGCGRPQYAKSLCTRHYSAMIRGALGQVDKRCIIPNCQHHVETDHPFCDVHMMRWLNSMRLKRKNVSIRGERNHRWNGGTSGYKNHYDMKKIRKVKMEQAGYKCELCHTDNKRLQLHHKDRTKYNHNIENLLLLCTACHGLQRKGMKYKKDPIKQMWKSYTCSCL